MAEASGMKRTPLPPRKEPLKRSTPPPRKRARPRVLVRQVAAGSGMASTPPSRAEEKRWLDRLAQHGCVITGARQPIQLHHCMGRAARSQRLHIGRWFVLPLHFDLHDVSSSHPHNVTHRRRAFVEAYGRECDLFLKLCRLLERAEPLPFGQDVLDAILATRR